MRLYGIIAMTKKAPFRALVFELWGLLFAQHLLDLLEGVGGRVARSAHLGASDLRVDRVSGVVLSDGVRRALSDGLLDGLLSGELSFELVRLELDGGGRALPSLE